MTSFGIANITAITDTIFAFKRTDLYFSDTSAEFMLPLTHVTLQTLAPLVGV